MVHVDECFLDTNHRQVFIQTTLLKTLVCLGVSSSVCHISARKLVKQALELMLDIIRS